MTDKLQLAVNDQSLINTLIEWLSYCPDSPSGLIWRKSAGRVKKGSYAGSLNKNKKSGYYDVTVDGRKLRAHRVVWMLEKGHLPDLMDIDHIDGDRTNNKIENLRVATRAENLMNMSIRPDNSTGVKGLSRHLKSDGWDGRIWSKGKLHRKFSTSRQVVEDWLIQKRTELHGEFARHT